MALRSPYMSCVVANCVCLNETDLVDDSVTDR